MEHKQLFFAIVLMGLCTLVLRTLPYWFLHNITKNQPAWLVVIREMMPAGMMVILVLFCLQNVDFHQAQSFLPPTLGIVFTALCHLLLRNPLVSIVLGTLGFMGAEHLVQQSWFLS